MTPAYAVSYGQRTLESWYPGRDLVEREPVHVVDVVGHDEDQGVRRGARERQYHRGPDPRAADDLAGQTLSRVDAATSDIPTVCARGQPRAGERDQAVSRRSSGSASRRASATRAGRPGWPRRGSRRVERIAVVAAAGDHDVADPGQHRRRRAAPNQPRAIASSRVSTSARSPSTPARSRPRRRRRRAAVEVPEPGLAAEQHDAVAQLGVLVDVDPARPAGCRPCRGRRPRAAGSSAGSVSRSCSASASTIDSCCSHWLEATPYRWPVQSRSPSYR